MKLPFLLVAAALSLAAQPLPFKIVFANEKDHPAYNKSLGYGYDYKTTPGDGKPFYFSAAVPEGNFNVTLGLGDASTDCVTTVRAESRRLMLEDIHTAAGKIEPHMITVNVRNSRLAAPPANAPGGSEVRPNEREADVTTWE